MNLAKPEIHPSVPAHPRHGKGFGAVSPESVAALRQEIDSAATDVYFRNPSVSARRRHCALRRSPRTRRSVRSRQRSCALRVIASQP